MNSLTIEQLKALEVGDWVWIKDTGDKDFCILTGYYQIKGLNETHIHLKQGLAVDIIPYALYGKWLAYKNKEQAETKGDFFELPCKAGDIIFVPYVYSRVRGIMRLRIDEIQITKHSIVFCTDFETDDETFAIKFSHGLFLLETLDDIWFTDESKAVACLKEL